MFGVPDDVEPGVFDASVGGAESAGDAALDVGGEFFPFAAVVEGFQPAGGVFPVVVVVDADED